MSLSHLSPLLLATFSTCALATPMQPSTTATTPTVDDTSVHARCTQVRPGMNYREALALMGRAPDSTLSGCFSTGPSESTTQWASCFLISSHCRCFGGGEIR